MLPLLLLLPLVLSTSAQRLRHAQRLQQRQGLDGPIVENGLTIEQPLEFSTIAASATLPTSAPQSVSATVTAAASTSALDGGSIDDSDGDVIDFTGSNSAAAASIFAAEQSELDASYPPLTGVYFLTRVLLSIPFRRFLPGLNGNLSPLEFASSLMTRG